MGYRKNTISNVNAEGQERPNVPNLRFIDESWVIRKIGNILKIKNGKNQKDVEKVNGKNPIYGTGGVIGWTDEFLYNKPSVCIGRKGTIDKPIYLEIPFWTVDTLFYSEINNGYIPRFVYYLFQTIDWKFYDQSTGVPSLTSSVIENIKINVPSYKTQEKLSIFLTKIDERIEAQSKIIEEIISFKNCIANRLIFNNTALKQIVKLEDISTLKNGYAFKSDSYNDDGRYKVITIANVSGDRYIQTETSNRVVKINNDIQEHQVLKINDILISLTGNVGRVSLVNEDDCLLNQRVGVLIPFNINFREYIYQVLSTKKFENAMILAGQGVAQKNIGDSDVLGFKIPFTTDYDYLNKLSSILQKIDHKIQKEKDILELYKKQKAYLLQNLFI